MKLPALVLAAAVVLSTPAWAQKVSVEYASHEDFSKFATYKWGKNKGELPDAHEDNRIKDKIDDLLQAKGLRRVASGPADLVVAYQATMNEKQEVDTYDEDPDMGLGYGWGWGMGWGWGWGDEMPGYSASTTVEIRRGDLLVDMVNPTTKKIVLRGYSSGAFHSDPVKEDRLLSKSLNKTFKNFPPKQKTRSHDGEPRTGPFGEPVYRSSAAFAGEVGTPD